MTGHPSQGNRLLQDPAPDPGPEQAGGRDIHPAAQQALKVIGEAPEIEERPSRFEVHEKVDVARLTSVMPCDRAEYADIGGAIPPADLPYPVLIPCKKAVEIHGRTDVSREE